jgi:hypothetical protein
MLNTNFNAGHSRSPCSYRMEHVMRELNHWTESHDKIRSRMDIK